MRRTMLVFALLTPSCASQHDEPEARIDPPAFGDSAQPTHEAASSEGVAPLREGAAREGIASLDCHKPLMLDVAAPSVAGIRLDAPDSLIEASLPPRSVKRNARTYGADTVITYTITLCGHVLELGSNGISTTDPAFITTEGLRVGLPIAQFDETWGQGQLIWSEAGWVMYYFRKVSINAGVNACVSFPRPDAQPTVRRDCEVASIWVSTPARVGAR